jgi:hypothetical protein
VNREIRAGEYRSGVSYVVVFHERGLIAGPAVSTPRAQLAPRILLTTGGLID